MSLVACPCCGSRTLPRRGAGDKCKRCGWSDWPEQDGRNSGLSLGAARELWENYQSLNPADYTPNEVPLGRRVFNGLVAFLVIAYCGFGLWAGYMVLPGRAGTIILEGAEVWLMSAALVSGAMYGVLSIVDHYDRRRNEHVYHKVVKACFALMAAFMGLAIVLNIYRSDGAWLALAVGFMMLLIVFGVVSSLRHRKIEF